MNRPLVGELGSSLPRSSLSFSPNTEPVHRLGNLSVRSGKNGPRVLTDAFYMAVEKSYLKDSEFITVKTDAKF